MKKDLVSMVGLVGVILCMITFACFIYIANLIDVIYCTEVMDWNESWTYFVNDDCIYAIGAAFLVSLGCCFHPQLKKFKERMGRY